VHSLSELVESGQLVEPVRLTIKSGQETVLVGFGLILVPDVLVTEAVANGLPDPTEGTWQIQTPEGRTVYVFAWNEADAA